MAYYWDSFTSFTLNDQHSALEISDLSELTVHIKGAVAETASNIYILHNHNLCWVLSYSKVPKPCLM
jgi:hypothetical protein